MKKTAIRRTVGTFFALIMTVSVLNYSISSNKFTVSAAADYNLWTEYATEKICRDTTYHKEESGNKTISVSMVKNEYESAQLIISAKSDISSYNLNLSNLVNENGDVFSSDMVTVYNQSYIQILRQSNSYSKLGWYPDALLPMATAVEHGENKVKAGDNQGIWIKFRSNEDTNAGVYRGSYTLTVNGVSESIPVEVKVYDLTIPEYEWDSTSYLLWTEYLTYGEHDSSYEMWTAYYDFFLDYGISLYGTPSENGNVASYLANVKKYHDQVSSYAIPYKEARTLQATMLMAGPDYEHIEDVIRGLISMSKEDGKDYVSKAYVYNLFIDEYTATHAFGEQRIRAAERFAPEMIKIFQSCVDYYDSAYGTGYIDSVPGLRNSILNIRLISVSSWLEGVTNYYNVFCSAFPAYQLEESRLDYAQKMDGEFDEMWWYGGVGTNYPSSPSYQIDDPLIDERVLGWMAYDYNIKGNLYWAANLYSDNSPGYYMPGDAWTLANRSMGSVNGDGWLVYPGQKYGIYGPVGTVRLEAIRDGMEETKYLRLLDQRYAALNTYYGEDFSSRATLQSIYSAMYNGVLADTDSDNFYRQREMTLEAMQLAQSPEKIAITSLSEDLSKYTVSVVLDSGITGVSGYVSSAATANGKGRVYTFNVGKGDGNSVLTFDYTVNGQSKTYRKVLGEGYYTKIAFDKEADGAALTLSGAAGTAKNGIVTKDEKSGLSFTIKSPAVAGIIGPYAYLKPAEIFAAEIDDLKTITMDIYNDNSADVFIQIMQRTKNQSGIVYDLTVLTTTLKAKEWNRVIIKDLYAIKYAQDLRIVMPRTANQSYSMIISNLSYNLKSEVSQ